MPTVSGDLFVHYVMQVCDDDLYYNRNSFGGGQANQILGMVNILISGGNISFQMLSSKPRQQYLEFIMALPVLRLGPYFC